MRSAVHLKMTLMSRSKFSNWYLVILWFLPVSVHCFSWSTDKSQGVEEMRTYQDPFEGSLRIAGTNARLSKKYEITLRELKDLESEPLCHRIAARLLVNNCQLLDGHDDATILTDSGRATRDFVDSYAASLAICDLERGSFVIPSSCAKFREPVLARISAPAQPDLHVSTTEIDACLEGLAQMDSAWNTWVSYRHKALRFCDAARADHDREQNILLFQKLTNILANLTEGVEAELEHRFQSMERLFQETGDRVRSLAPEVDKLYHELGDIRSLVADNLLADTRESATFVSAGLEDARLLQKILESLLRTASTNEIEIASSHELALRDFSERVETGLKGVMTTLAAATAVSASLQRELENSQTQAAEVEKQQQKIGAGLKNIEDLAGQLMQQHDRHHAQLQHAQNAAEGVLATLGLVSSAASQIQNTMSSGLSLKGWWPYLLCPSLSLIMGSYGLGPSVTRNFWLISVGEAVALAISATNYAFPLHISTDYTNTTSHLRPSAYIDNTYTNSDIIFEAAKWSSKVY